MTRLIFVRHGESEHNRDGLISTSTPGPDLSPEGVQQSVQLAERLEGPLAAVYTSPATRAHRTARFIAERFSVPIVVADDLMELYAGVVDGTSAAEGLPRIDAGWERWVTHGEFDEPIAPKGESATSVIARMRRLIARIQAGHPQETRVAVVSHGGILQLAVPAICINLTLDHGRRNWLRNVETIEAHGDGPDLTCDLWAGAPVPPDALVDVRDVRPAGTADVGLAPRRPTSTEE